MPGGEGRGGDIIGIVLYKTKNWKLKILYATSFAMYMYICVDANRELVDRNSEFGNPVSVRKDFSRFINRPDIR